MELKLSPYLAKFVLRLNPFDRFKVMCRGYGKDFENFTELVWEDDKYWLPRILSGERVRAHFSFDENQKIKPDFTIEPLIE